jgi:hypothetical protein
MALATPAAPTLERLDNLNLTPRNSPRNPTSSYRSRALLRILGEVEQWEGHSPVRLKQMKDALARMEAEGGAQIID